MKLALEPISSVADNEIWHVLIELITILNGSCALDDLEWDDDELLASLLDAEIDRNIRRDYELEPQAGIQVAKDRFISELVETLTITAESLGKACPYTVINDGETLLKRRPASDLCEAALAYAWLVMFWVISSGSDYLVVAKGDRDKFLREFAPIFEWICCLVLKSRQPTKVWYLGDSRNVKELLRRLGDVIMTTGNGVVKAQVDVEANQAGANDAGVDVFGIQTHGGVVRRDSQGFLLGATIQRDNRSHKIMGLKQINRFTSFFSRAPSLAFQGILAIPFPPSPIEELNCRDENCIYITKIEIIRILSQYPSDVRLLRDIRVPRRNIRLKTRGGFGGAVLRVRNNQTSFEWV